MIKVVFKGLQEGALDVEYIFHIDIILKAVKIDSKMTGQVSRRDFLDWSLKAAGAYGVLKTLGCVMTLDPGCSCVYGLDYSLEKRDPEKRIPRSRF